MPRPDAPRWLLLIHAIPPKPEYLRVKVARRLARVGAVPVKNSVYVLPRSDEALEDFQWVLREVTGGGGECAIGEVAFVGGLTDDGVERLFHNARRADYAEITAEAGRLRQAAEADHTATARRGQLAAEIARLRRRCSEVQLIDFFHAEGGSDADAAIGALERMLESIQSDRPDRRDHDARGAVRGRTWVTRRGIKVDRISSAWLIRRFIDPEARFRFVDADGFVPADGELRFDMFDAEYTHDGPRCTFETLVHRFELDDPALGALGEIVHDIDFKERAFDRAETPGFARLVDGLVASHAVDEARLRHGSVVLDTMYAGLQGAPPR
jgi:hypothetical protein